MPSIKKYIEPIKKIILCIEINTERITILRFIFISTMLNISSKT